MTVIENKAARMNQLIADLLAFSQLGAQEIHPAPVDMDLLLSDAVRDLFPDGLPGNLVLQVDSLGTPAAADYPGAFGRRGRPGYL